ncbi:MAG: molecular chaperone HtpG, partial [Proteobacteria bacterium]|nr:molecular chaperone HtpG [Pseudomonadota bacterium]
MAGESTSTHRFEAEVTQVLGLVINSLYSNKEIFLRELVSNAADALDKLRFRAIAEPALLPEGHRARVRLIPNERDSTLTIDDNGVGMTSEELADNLGTVAKSGSRAFLQSLEEADQKNLNLIGQFGVGFYSAYLISDSVDVLTRAAGEKEASRWSSDGKETYTIEPAERDEVGTSVVLHVRPEHKDFLSEWRLRELVRRYSDFLSYPIELQVTRSEAGEEKRQFTAINEASALWQRRPEDVTDEQYAELYRHLTRDWEPPLARTHFSVEGTQMFTGLLFIPRRPPLDLFSPEGRHGVRLYVKRVFIMDDCDELLPRWLRFVRGLIDSEDLPLNVSRELLQDSVVVRTIRKQVVRRVLGELDKLAASKPDGYLEFWRNFGAVIKEGLHFEPEHKDRLAPLLRFESSTEPGSLVSLPQYVARMREGQKSIYYAMGVSPSMLANSPHLEVLKKRGYEVLFMTDGIDQWALEGLTEFDDKPLANAMDAELELSNESDRAASTPEQTNEAGEIRPLLDRFGKVLEGKVSEVRVSKRLTDSPVCLVIPKGGL